MELHTLGVDGGYTQKDVQEVARCLTGWSIDRQTGRFLFAPRRHDNGEKTVLGRRIPAAGGIDEVVLAMNATLEGQTTAHYIAERLEAFPVRLTQLAHGLPVGGELDYLDEGTLAQALRARRPMA